MPGSKIMPTVSVLVMLSDNCCCPCYTFGDSTKDRIRLSPEGFKDILLWAANAEQIVPELFFLTDATEPLDSSIASILQDMSEQVVTPLLPIDQQKSLGIPFSTKQTVIAGSLGQAVTLADNIHGRPIIVHIEHNEIGRLAESLLAIQDSVGHITLRLRDIHLLSDSDIKTYRKQLEDIADLGLMKTAAGAEDKLSISNLNMSGPLNSQFFHCLAGTAFVVIGPDSHIYPCPAFYYAGQEYSIGSISDEMNGFIKVNPGRQHCGICNSTKCPGCPFLEASQLAEREKICRIYEVENCATKDLLSRVAQSGYLFDCLRTLKTRDCASKSQNEGGEILLASQQVCGITFDEFVCSLCDLKSAAELLINKTAEDGSYNSILNRWIELQEIPSASQRSIFRRRVYELLTGLRQLNMNSMTATSK